jgi:phenylacetate-CoA ligase
MSLLRAALLFFPLRLNPRRSREALKRMQDRKLRRLLRLACKDFPYYRELFRKSGIAPGDIRSTGELPALPVTGKEELRRAIRDHPFIAAGSRWLSTSGSSGMPMRFPVLPADLTRMNMSWLRPQLVHGVRPWHRRLEITGPHNIRRQDRWYQRLGFFRLSQTSVFAAEEEWLEELNRSRPDVLWGYSRSLIRFAGFLAAQPKAFHRPRWIFGVSELVDDEGRAAIRKAFGRELIDLYGAVETGCAAWQCPACGEYHMNIDSLVIEFVPAAEPSAAGSPSSLVITNLHSRAFPILRYAIGDTGLPSARGPVCGCGLPLMTIIAGREDDAVMLPGGRRLSPLFFFAVMKRVPGLNRWRVRQHAGGPLRFSVELAPGAAFDKTRAESVIQEALAGRIGFVVEVVDAIPADSSGKQRSVIVT